ncbi:MAG: iron-sulfur cluster assembly scaffold protein IscU [Gammaproteobacteria bacterium]|nr:MAG: iron-sulfur cluster assembly scaffold protein IscU [Gammaproteobacteria bacterium]
MIDFELYSPAVLEHYERPRNVGALDPEAPGVGTGLVGSPQAGDVVKLQIRVDAEDRIVETRFKTYGCAAAIAAGSWLSERIEGLTLDEAEALDSREIAEALALPAVKMHCSVLVEDALRAAVADCRRRRAGA